MVATVGGDLEHLWNIVNREMQTALWGRRIKWRRMYE